MFVSEPMEGNPSPMSPHVEERSIAIYQEDVRRLEGLLGTDLVRRWGFSGVVDREERL